MPPYKPGPPIKRLTSAAVQEVMTSLNPKKASGHDTITCKILKELLPIGITNLTKLFNAILLTEYFPSQWKVAQFILILKPGKPPNELTTYHPISLLSIVSKVFEKLLQKRLLVTVANNKSIPNHQFGFRQRHCVAQKINQAFDSKQYCSANFIYIYIYIYISLKPSTKFGILDSYTS
jgi:hypothetical protein